MSNTKFNVLRKADSKKIGNYTYFVSEQEIVDEDKTSKHLVIKKVILNEDGTSQGNGKQLFITIDSSKALLEHALNFLNTRK